MARPNPSKAPSPFLALPTELRLQIYNYLLLSVNKWYLYECPYPPHLQYYPQHRYQDPLRLHGMVLANRQLHAEYAQAFYERTMFDFAVCASDHMWSTTTPFWTLPPALLPNLRRCRLNVRLGLPAPTPGFSMEAFVMRIKALLGRMERVQWVDIRWGLGGVSQVPGERWGLEEWWGMEQLWRRLGESFVQRLKGGAGIRGIFVSVQSQILGFRCLRLEKKGAEWVENRDTLKYRD